MSWQILDLGRLAYPLAFEQQRELNRAVSLGEAPSTLLLVEHEPVITLSHRRDIRDHLLATPAELERLGIDVQETDRGGDITYHGPGQLVAYPILRLGDYGLNLGRYMRVLEQSVIATIGRFGVDGQTEAGATGVWVATDQNAAEPTTAKICAMGVRIRKNTTMHGLALNVSTDLAHFQTIDPCGLGGRPVTSLQQRLGAGCPSMDQVKQELQRQLIKHVASGGADRS